MTGFLIELAIEVVALCFAQEKALPNLLCQLCSILQRALPVSTMFGTRR